MKEYVLTNYELRAWVGWKLRCRDPRGRDTGTIRQSQGPVFVFLNCASCSILWCGYESLSGTIYDHVSPQTPALTPHRGRCQIKYYYSTCMILYLVCIANALIGN